MKEYLVSRWFSAICFMRGHCVVWFVWHSLHVGRGR